LVYPKRSNYKILTIKGIICTHVKQTKIKVHIALMRTLKENGKSMKNFIFLKTATRFEENPII
jgi:hypothetical protein